MRGPSTTPDSAYRFRADYLMASKTPYTLGVAGLVVLPLLWWPGAADPWTTPKYIASLVLLTGILAVALISGGSWADQFSAQMGLPVLLAIGYVVAVLAAAFTSTDRNASFLAPVDDGVVPLVLRPALFLLFCLVGAPSSQSLKLVVAAHGIVAGYVVIQALGFDPFPFRGMTVEAASTVGNRNHTSTVLGAGLVAVTAGLITAHGKSRHTKSLFAVMIILLAGVILTGSRAAWLSIVVTLAVVGLRVSPHRRRSLAIGALSATVFITVIDGVLDGRLVGRHILRSVTELEGEAQVGSGRLAIWERTLELMPGHWLLGHGPGTFPDVFNAGSDHGSFVGGAHNEYLQLLFTVGPLAMIAFMWLLAWTLWSAEKLSPDDPFRLPLLAVVLYFAIKSLFNAAAMSDAPLLWAAMGVIVHRATVHRQTMAGREVTTPR